VDSSVLVWLVCLPQKTLAESQITKTFVRKKYQVDYLMVTVYVNSYMYWNLMFLLKKIEDTIVKAV